MLSPLDAPPSAIAVTDAVLRTRIAFVGLTVEDLEVLATWAPVLTAALPGLGMAFYRHIAAYPAPQALLLAHTTVARQQPLLQHYLATMLTGRIDDAYVALRQQVGRIHSQIDLDFCWFIGMYEVIRRAWCTAVHAAGATAPAQARFATALGRILALDIALVTSALTEERHLLYERLAHAKAVADVATQAKDTFLSAMSHELRTPMNGVLGMTDLLRDTPLDAEQQEYVEIIKASGEALLTLINTILRYTELTADRLTLESCAFDVRSAVEDCLLHTRQEAHAKHLVLHVEVATDVPAVVRGDPDVLQHILGHLLKNAVTFTPMGTITLRVLCVAETHDVVHLRFEVQDTGIGIPEAAQAQVFTPFTQVESATTRRYGGAGLGLAMTQQLVTRLGGTIGVQSTVGKGSLFWCVLPFVPNEAGARA